MRKFLFALAALFTAFGLGAKEWRVTDFGAKADGITVNTRIIQKAIDFVSGKGGGTLVFTPGSFVTGTVFLKSGVTLYLESGATILGSTNAFDYVMSEVAKWTALIIAENQEDVGIVGKGTVNCRGFVTANSLVQYANRGVVEINMAGDRPAEPHRPSNLLFRDCTNVTVKGIHLQDPASWNQVYDRCRNVLIEDVTADCKSYWNNDGLDIVDSEDVVVRNCSFDAADDAFCLKSHSKDHICQNILIENCTARSSASALKFGTRSDGGFRHVRVVDFTVYDTYRSAMTFATVDGGVLEDIVVDGVKSYHTGNVIYLREGRRYTEGNTPVMRDITIRNVYAEVPAEKPDKGYNYEGPVEHMPRNTSPCGIVGVPGFRISGVLLQNIEIVYPGGGSENFAWRGTSPEELAAIPEMETAYPEFSQFRELPAWGLYIRHADDITLDNVKFRALKADYRPALVADDVNGLTLKGVTYTEPSPWKEQEVFNNVERLVKE
ncbi:MAG: glycoside hydrolase [Bacteroidales bacterium]|nr:glycoside hydrolase [Bacteroidales bacterium]